MCNPVFDRSGDFIETLMEAFRLDKSTKAVLVVPARER